jgi:hypothetical protein
MATGIAPVCGDYMNLSYYKPPWEIEICFAAPDDTSSELVYELPAN